MDPHAYAEMLLGRLPAPPLSDPLAAAEQHVLDYLKHLLVMQKYVQEYSEDGPYKRVEILLMTRVLDGFVTGTHLLRARFYNVAITEFRVALDSLNLIQWLTICEPALNVFLAPDATRVLREFSSSRVRQSLNRTPHDTLHDFLISYATHPFYTGREYLLGVDLVAPGHVDFQPRMLPTLDAVCASVQLMAMAHTALQFSTHFGLATLLDQDRDFLARMFNEINAYLATCEKLVEPHRSIRAVILDFRQNFPLLFDRRFVTEQGELAAHYQKVKAMYRDGSLPYPPKAEAASERRSATGVRGYGPTSGKTAQFNLGNAVPSSTPSPAWPTATTKFSADQLLAAASAADTPSNAPGIPRSATSTGLDFTTVAPPLPTPASKKSDPALRTPPAPPAPITAPDDDSLTPRQPHQT